MLIELTDVVSCVNKEIVTEVQIGLTSFSSRLGEFPITKKAPVELTITNEENRQLLIRGRVKVTVLIPCSRCLEDVSTDICFSIEKKLKIEDGALNDDEMEEIDYLIGLNLDVDKFIYGEILVNWPMKVLCKDDCKGICKVCGMNLNKGNCNCQKTELDPRMAAIQDVFNKFKEV